MREDFDLISMGFNTKGNLDCIYCNAYSPAQQKTTLDSIRIVNAILTKAHEGRRLAYDWGGAGEPLLYKRFDEMITLLRNHNTEGTIYSNCTRYSQALADGIRDGKIFLICSIDSGTRETYVTMKGPDLFTSVVKTLKRYAEHSKNNIILKYVLTDYNLGQDDIEQFIALCKELGIKKIILSRDMYHNELTEEIVRTRQRLASLAEAEGIAYALYPPNDWL